MESQITPDKRRSFRLPAAFRVEAAPSDARDVRGKSIMDISAVGLRMISDEPLSRGEEVRIRIPDVETSSVIRGEVVWCSPTEKEGYEIGIRFAGNAGTTTDRIYTRIREIESFRETARDILGRDLTPAAAAREWFERFGTEVR